MFKINKKISVDLIDFSINHIGTGQIGGYIINFLYKEFDFRHIGYRLIETNEGERCVLYTLPDNKEVINYFKDRCSGMIEEKVQSIEGIPHKHNKWENGFEEVIKFKEENINE